ncbi:MAG: ATP-binding protein, partial [Longimonas sp.]|uniref:ATP-binding protein n=1 Tax=Longimonas sp. TaxID=2039626 RepID=UPI00336155B3
MPTRLASDVRAVPDPMGGAHEVRSEEEAATGRWGQPYLYSSWWFYGIVVFLSLAVLAGAFWIWIVMHRKRKAELRRVVQERTEELHREKQKTKEALALAQDQAERLKRIDDSKSRFFARISHEFRTPLTLTLGPVDYVLKSSDLALPPNEREQLRIAQRNAMRLARLVNQLHDLAKLETGAMAIHPEQRDIVAFVASSVSTFQGLADQRDITLTFDSDSEAQPFVFDSTKLEKVIANLLINAFQATESGDHIRVTLQTRDSEFSEGSCERVTITVEDTVAGIPAGQRAYLQAAFQDSDTDEWDHEGGFMGTGLTLVNELVTLHGGNVRLQSHEDMGTTFTISILRQEIDDGGLPDTSPGSSEVGGRPLRLAKRFLSLEDGGPAEDKSDLHERDQTTVLIADDNPDFRSYLRWHLEPTYRVVEAENGTAAYQTARSILPDIALVDIICQSGVEKTMSPQAAWKGDGPTPSHTSSPWRHG